MKECIFCNCSGEVVLENMLCYMVWDKNPVAEGHALVIPHRHVVSYFELTGQEVVEMHELVGWMKKFVDDHHHPVGYNLGVNEGEAAGRTIHHVHLHLIPCYEGDVPNPRGGVRGVIPGKADY